MEKEMSFDLLMGISQYMDNPTLENLYKENQTIYLAIKNMTLQNNILPFIGAGFSAEIYPTWSKFLLDTANAYPDCEEDVQKLLEQGEYEEAADILCEEMTEFGFYNKIAQTFGKQTIANQFENFSIDRKKLSEIFRCNIATTNYDRILETIYHNELETICPHTEYQQSFLEKVLQSNESVLLKLHGDIEDIRNIVIKTADYEKHYGKLSSQQNPTMLVQVLKQILQNHAILFLGCSLYTDRTMQVLLDNTGSGRQFYALVELPQETQNIEAPFSPILLDTNGRQKPAFRNRRKFLSNHHIRCIWYPYGRHDAMNVFLRKRRYLS